MATEITISKNIEKNGIEVRFSQKPSKEILADLKANQFRWSPLGSCWYTKYSDEMWQYANSLTVD